MKSAPRLAANLDCKADRWFQQFGSIDNGVAANMRPERNLEPVCALKTRAGYSVIISFRSMADGVAAMFATMILFVIPVALMLCGLAGSLWGVTSRTDGFG
jgi:hypothetical protein